MYQIVTKYIEWPSNKTNVHNSIGRPSQIAIYGLKKYHLATPVRTCPFWRKTIRCESPVFKKMSAAAES
jgi:hypothetical protein